MEEIRFVVTADNRDFIMRMEGARGELARAVREAESGGASVRSVLDGLERGLMRVAAASASAFTAAKALEFARECVKVRSEVESLEQSFDVLLGDSGQARALISGIREFAASTPMDMDVLAKGAQTMLGFNVEAEKVMPVLRSIGDISMGSAEKFGSLTLAFSQMTATGKLMGQDLLQMINAGFNPLAEISRKTGKSIGELKGEMEKGRVSAEMVADAFMSAAAEGGKFHGMLERQSEGLRGAFAYLRGSISQFQNDVGAGLSGPVTDAVNLAGDLVRNYEDVGEVMAVLVSMYGAYKAAVVASAAAAAGAEASASAAAQAAFRAETEALAELTSARGGSAAGGEGAAAANSRLTASQAALVASLRQEARAHVESLEAKAANARAAVMEAAAELQAAQVRSGAAIEAEKAASRRYVAALKAGDRSAILSARTALETAEEARNTAARDVNTASVNYQAAAKAHETAATEASAARKRLDTAATLAGAAAEKEAARSSGVLAMAKQKLSGALDKVWSAMSAHPYGIALAAVVALTYGTYKLVTAQTEAEKAQRRLNEAFSRGEADAQAEGVQVRALFDRLKRAKEGTQEWDEARGAIWSKYGPWLSRLGDEATALNDVARAYSLVAGEAEKAARARAMDAAVQSEGDLYKETYSGNFDRIYDYIADKKGKSFADAYRAEIAKVISGELNWTESFLRQFDREVTAVRSTVPGGNAQPVSKYTANTLRDYTEEARRAAGEYRRNIDRIYDKWGRPGKEDKGGKGGGKGPLLKEDYDKALKEYEEAKARVAGMEADRASHTTKEYTDAVARLKGAKEAFEKLGGDTKEHKGPTSAQLEAREENAAGKLADIIRKQAAERLRIEQDYEYERWQSRIDLMQEGEAKVLAQQNLDFDKEKNNLRRRLADDLEAELNRQMAVFDAEQNMLAAADKKYAKKTFRDSDIDQGAMDAVKARYAALQEDLTKSQQKAEAGRLQSAKESFNAYLQEFGTYQQKREAIATGYDTRIAAAANAGDRMMLEAQKRKALSGLDCQQWIDSGEIALAFGDISNLSRQTVSRLIGDMEKYREKVVATFDPEKIAKYEEALNNLRMADAENTFSAFGSMVPEYFTRRLAIQKQINDEAQIGLELTRRQNELSMRTEAQKGAVKIQAKAAGLSISDEDLAEPAKVQQIADKVAAASASGNKFASALHSALLELLKLNGESAELEKATKTWDGNFSHLKETLDNLEGEEKFNAICESVASAADLVGGLASQASEMADSMGAEGLGKALGALGDAMGSVRNVASGFAQGGLVGGIAAAAGEAMNWAAKLAMAGDARHQKNIERLQERIDALGISYEKAGKAAEKAFSADAGRLLGQQAELLSRQRELVALQLEEERAKKKSDSDAIKGYEEQLRELDDKIEETRGLAKDAIFGEDIRSQIERFAEDYSNAWEQGESRALTARETVRGMMQGMVKEAVKAAIEGGSAMAAIRERLEGFFSDGVLSLGEQEEIYGMADRLQKELDARLGDNASLLAGGRMSQSATSRGWETMSQEQGDALTGRFTALCETGERIREVNTAMSESLAGLAGTSDRQRELLQDALNVHLISMGHLEAISKNTRELATIREGLDKIERRLRNIL